MSENREHKNPKPSSVDRLTRFWPRINEHKVVQWTVAYVAIAYGIQHAVILTSESFDWPNAIARVSMLLLALGLPLVITLAWYHGARASRQISRAEMSIITILLVIGTFVFYVLARPSQEIAANPPVREAGVAAARSASLNPHGAISVAVMPFANLSNDKDQEFFSDGMTDEISGALAKIPDLRVVGRSSAFEFKGKNVNIKTMGEELGATHLIEGSVRKVGARLRISAQLIQAGNGLQIWSENYDRDLTDVFAVQEDIARAIAVSLRMPLGLKPGERLISSRIADPEIYAQYLGARARLRARGAVTTGPGPREILEGVVARAPGFAPGWATLAEADITGTVGALRRGDFKLVASFSDKAEGAARKAIALDPGYGGGYAELAAVLSREGKWAQADDLFKQALALDPNDPELLENYSQGLWYAGRLKEGLRMRLRLRVLEPLVPIYNQVTAIIMQENGQIDASIAILEPDKDQSPQRNVGLAKAYAAKGRFAEAAETLLRITRQITNRRSVEDAALLLRSAPSQTDAPEKLPHLDADLGFVYAYVGAPERMLEYPEMALKAGYVLPFQLIWDPLFAPLRKTERFKTLMRNAGLVDYWRTRGWPDLCHPVGAGDFACG